MAMRKRWEFIDECPPQDIFLRQSKKEGFFMDMYIVLAVTIFMMVMFVWHKVPFGVTTMTCCVILMVTGVIDLNTTFSGFGNKIVVLIAPMLALGGVLGKTNLVANLQELMIQADIC